jgi:HEAT repeat protein
VRQAAVQALGQFHGKAVCATLRAVIVQDPDLWVRTRAVEQLERLRDVGSSSLLVQTLNQSPFPLQKAIVKALGTIGDTTLVEVLQEMQHHQEPEIKEAARVAIRQLMTSPSPSEVIV